MTLFPRVSVRVKIDGLNTTHFNLMSPTRQWLEREWGWERCNVGSGNGLEEVLNRDVKLSALYTIQLA